MLTRFDFLSLTKTHSFELLLETMTTSWASSSDVSNAESVSSSSTDKNELGHIIPDHSRSSSEGSLFSDSDIQQDQSNRSVLLDQERRPSFLMPTS